MIYKTNQCQHPLKLSILKLKMLQEFYISNYLKLKAALKKELGGLLLKMDEN